MNREEFIQILRSYLFNNFITSNVGERLIQEYIFIKKNEKIEKLDISGMFGQQLFSEAVSISLEFFEKHFEVVKVIDKNNRLIDIF